MLACSLASVTIRTARLLLRAPELADARPISLLAGDYEVASMTGTIPHPYTERMAADWIASVLDGEEGVVFAIVHSDTLIGCTGYRAFSRRFEGVLLVQARHLGLVGEQDIHILLHQFQECGTMPVDAERIAQRQ